MRTPSGLLHVVDFKTDQIISAIQPKDYWADNRHWEIKSNIDTFDFKTFDGTPHAVTLQQQNLVLKEVRDGRIVPYVINNEVEKDSKDRSLTVHSSGAWVQIAKDGIIKPQRIESETVNTFIDIALADSKWQRGITDYSSFHTMTIDEFIDPLTFLKKIAALFELEIQYRVEVSGSQITGWYVDMINKRGRETGKEVTLGKDLVGVRRIEHSRDICTALVGFVRGEGDKLITVESINKGLPYIVDNDAFQRWNQRGKHKFGFYTPETSDQDMTPERLMTLMKTELRKRVNTSVSYEVEAQSIGRIFGLAHELINEGDTIRIKDTGFTPKLYLEARVIAGDESFTDPTQDKYVFGDYREITDPNEELRKIYNRILSSLGSKQELINQLDELVKDANETASNAKKESEAAKTLAEKVQENLKNNTVDIIEAKNPPTTGLKPYKTLWRDISNGKPGILKIWTGTVWESVVPDVESVKKETLEQVTKEINASAEKLDARVKEAETKADNLQKDFNAVKGEQERVSQVTKALEESDEATKETITSIQGTQEDMNKTIVETTKGVEGLKNTVSDIKKDQNGITDRVVKTEQNINGISSSIEQINKTSSQTVQKLNKVEEDANGTKQTIERIEKNVNNLDGDVINLVRGTKTLTTNEELSLKGGRLVVIKDTYNGNAIAQTDTEWQGITVKPSELIKRGKIKIGDTVTFSVTARMIGGESTQIFFPNSAGETTVNGEWKRVSVTIPVGSDATDPNVVYRFEAESIPKGALYQQTSPMLSLTKKVYPWRPAPEDQADSNEFIKVTTEIKTEAGKISTKLEQVEARTVGVENWLINTGPNERPQTIGMIGGAVLNKVTSFVQPGEYVAIECQDHTDAFYQFHLDNTKIGDFEKGKDITISLDIQNDVLLDFILFQYINGSWSESVQKPVPAKDWRRESWTFKIDVRATGWGFRIRFARNEASKGKRFRFKKAKLEKGSVPTDFSKSTYELEQSVDGVKSTVTKVQDSQAGFEKRMTTVEQTATGLSSTVSDLNNVVSDQGKKLTDANTKLEQQATAIGAKVELKQVEDYVAGFKIPELKQTVDKNKQDLLGELANKLATEQFNQKMTLIDNRFIINEQGINASAKKTEVYTKEQANGQFATSSYVRDMETRLQLTEKGVSISVKENDVIAAFNMSKENITLNANRINLVGFITANHIKGKVLEGVTLKTSGNRFVEINKQDMKIFDADKPRGYIGFMEANDGSIQPSLVLGSDNRKYAGTGSFYIYQVMPRINGVDQPSKAYATFGISKGENAEGTNIWSSYINMQNDGGHLYAYAAGRLYFDNLNDIVFNSVGWAPGYGKFIVTTTEPHYFKNDYGEFHFDRKSTGNSIYFANGVNDHDLVMGRVMIRASLVSGYDMSLQIKDVYGNGWRDIELRTLRAKENISATGRMWAQEFIPNSSRTLKTDIEDLPFSALDKINSVNIKQYHFIRDVERFESGESITLPINYGMIAEDSDDVFTTPQKDAVTLYSSFAISIQAIQEVDFKVKNLQFDHGMWKQEVDTLKEQLEAEKLEKVSMKAEIYELKVLVQQLINEKPKQP
ncbi:tail fiber domain-containing protein [Bacillus sp. ZZQ-131]|uniref:phage tail spike protein n=1 Tax=Bacillus thuringiensis TaxID=1428 RepID=UPI001CBE30DA|nr:phage tail spike protein [Bacillus thuringiensis]MDA2112298.1 tail fiber domain-containing protein [Bacillus cereus]MDA2129553.1 tail fiber domain-containing protein [Bacillus cereus]MDA2150399.1 tail fiber domain-containing protein [Bacillus cereus]MEB9162566.1 phage tail spike protein [Bacillus cereus]USP56423.1 Chromosome partition protein Smc [Bacillus thuringiensis]